MSEFENIRAIFLYYSKHLKYDVNLVNKIERYNNAFVNKDEEHVKFFGGNLTGVNVVRFTTIEKNDWVIDLLGYEEHEVRSKIIRLPTVNPEWVRGTDIMNLSCLWLLHCFNNSGLPPKDKERGMIEVMKTLHYKYITSILAHYFRYPVNEQLALSVYAQLSKKYAIKQHGNWSKVLLERAKDIISPTSIHKRTIERFDDDGAIQYMVTDTQGRMRNMIKNIWSVFEQVHSEDARLLSNSAMVEIDGVKVLNSMTRDVPKYIRYINSTIKEKNAFIKNDLVIIISSEVKSAPDKLFRDALTALSEISLGRTPKSYKKERDPYSYVSPTGVETLCNEIIMHATDVLNKDRSLMRNRDYRVVISRLRALHMASRSSDPAVLKIREMSEIIVGSSINTKNPALIAATKTACVLYIVLRTLTMDFYS